MLGAERSWGRCTHVGEGLFRRVGESRGHCAHVGGRVFRKERVRGFARPPPAAERFGGRESRGRYAHPGSGVFRSERVGGVVRTDAIRSADRAREAVRGLPGWVTDCTAVDASSVHARLLRFVLAFLRRPQVPPPDPHPCPPSLDLRRDERTLDGGTPSLATSVVCPMT